jgi:hypothetical protein
MQAVRVTQKVFASALVTLALLTGALLVAAPKASASMGQCPENSVCIWSKSGWTGDFTSWPASQTGCHNHESIPSLRSGWNRTGYNVYFGWEGPIPPGEAFYLTAGEPSITGNVCW